MLYRALKKLRILRKNIGINLNFKEVFRIYNKQLRGKRQKNSKEKRVQKKGRRGEEEHRKEEIGVFKIAGGARGN